MITQSPDISSPLCTGGKFDSFLPFRADLMEAATSGFSVSSTVIESAIIFSLSFSSGSLLILSGLVMLIFIRDGAVGMGGGVESSSTFPSMVLLIAVYVVSTVVRSFIILSSGSENKNLECYISIIKGKRSFYRDMKYVPGSISIGSFLISTLAKSNISFSGCS